MRAKGQSRGLRRGVGYERGRRGGGGAQAFGPRHSCIALSDCGTIAE